MDMIALWPDWQNENHIKVPDPTIERAGENGRDYVSMFTSNMQPIETLQHEYFNPRIANDQSSLDIMNYGVQEAHSSLISAKKVSPVMNNSLPESMSPGISRNSSCQRFTSSSKYLSKAMINDNNKEFYYPQQEYYQNTPHDYNDNYNDNYHYNQEREQIIHHSQEQVFDLENHRKYQSNNDSKHYHHHQQPLYLTHGWKQQVEFNGTPKQFVNSHLKHVHHSDASNVNCCNQKIMNDLKDDSYLYGTQSEHEFNADIGQVIPRSASSVNSLDGNKSSSCGWNQSTNFLLTESLKNPQIFRQSNVHSNRATWEGTNYIYPVAYQRDCETKWEPSNLSVNSSQEIISPELPSMHLPQEEINKAFRKNENDEFFVKVNKSSSFQQEKRQKKMHDYSIGDTPNQTTNRIRMKYLTTEGGPSFFSSQHLKLWNIERTDSYTVNIAASMDKGFFKPGDVFTCYRRNYTQVVCSFSTKKSSYLASNQQHSSISNPCLVEWNNSLHRVTNFRMGISAKIYGCDKKVGIVQMTPRRDKGPQNSPPLTRCSPSTDNAIMYSSSECPRSICFDRIQFKQATANNGKRRARQQFFCVVISLHAELDTGATVVVASAVSSPFVVRGRSPGHYTDPVSLEDEIQTLPNLNINRDIDSSVGHCSQRSLSSNFSELETAPPLDQDYAVEFEKENSSMSPASHDFVSNDTINYNSRIHSPSFNVRSTCYESSPIYAPTFMRNSHINDLQFDFTTNSSMSNHQCAPIPHHLSKHQNLVDVETKKFAYTN